MYIGEYWRCEVNLGGKMPDYPKKQGIVMDITMVPKLL